MCDYANGVARQDEDKAVITPKMGKQIAHSKRDREPTKIHGVAHFLEVQNLSQTKMTETNLMLFPNFVSPLAVSKTHLAV